MVKKSLWLAVVAALAASTGCCRWCDRWCGQQHAGGYTPVHAAPACVPCQPVQCCPTPAAAPACVPVHSSPAAGWQRTPGGPGCP